VTEHRDPGDEDDDPSEALSQFDDDFAQAPVEEADGDVPDGKYQVTVDRVEITKAKTTGSTMLKWTLKILGPHHAGRLLWRNNVIGSRENLRWLKQDLHVCGLDLARLSDLPANLERLLDVKLEVTKRTKGENTNVYFNRRLILDAPASGGRHGRAKDDLPF
jgi:hypothetical protein